MDVLDVAYFIHQHMFYIEPCKLAFVGLSLVSLLICLFFFVNGVFLVFVCWTAQHKFARTRKPFAIPAGNGFYNGTDHQFNPTHNPLPSLPVTPKG